FVGQRTRQHDRQHEEPDEGTVAERPFREVEAAHFTVCPATRLCTPTVTTRSPAAMPLLTEIDFPLRAMIVTSRSATLPVAGSTIQTCALPPCSSSAVAGRSMRGGTSRLSVTEIVMPSRKAGGGSLSVR